MAAERWNQCQIVLDAMRKGESVNRVQAVQKYGIKSLGKVVSMLRAEGFDFDMQYERESSRRVLCNYSLKQA